MQMYNEYQTLSYTAKYGSPKPKVKHTYFVVSYGKVILSKPMYYSGCQVELKVFKQMGIQYPDKTKFKIIGV